MTTDFPRSAIITGAASGIGRACALHLASTGCALTLADRDADALHAVAAGIVAAGGRAQAVCTDVADDASVGALVAAAIAAFGALDGAINCAGVHQRGKPVWELTPADWDACDRVNLRGMFLCLRHQVAAMLGGGGAIVCVSSAAAGKGLINSADYCATKAGVTGLVRGAAVDCAERGIRVNALLPGATDTPLAHSSRDANPAIVGTLRVPIGRMATAAEIAACAVWLVSRQASYVTGACIAADGGMSIA